MASQSRRGGVLLPGRRRANQQPGEPLPQGPLAKLSNSYYVSKGKQFASDAAYVANKLIRSTGKAAWVAGTTLLIVVVPIVIELDREQQLADLELQQQSLLGAPPFPN